MQERSWLYSLGSHEDSGPWRALLLLFARLPWPRLTVAVQYPDLLLITEKSVEEEEEKSETRSLDK